MSDLVNISVVSILIVLIVIAIILFRRKQRIFEKTEYYNDKKVKRIYDWSPKIGFVGKDTYYFRNESKNKVQKWSKNKLEGEAITYYQTGEVYIKSNYFEGSLHGDYIVYNQDGSRVTQYKYEKGKKTINEGNGLNFSVRSKKENNLGIKAFFSKESIQKISIVKNKYNQKKKEQETIDLDKSNESVVKSFFKKISLVSAYENRKSTKLIKSACEDYHKEIQEITEEYRKELNKRISDFGVYRLNSLQDTTGVFLGILKDMKQKHTIKEYAILKDVGISNEEFQKMEQVDMTISKALQSTAAIGTLGAAAAMGTPTLVTLAVGKFAVASTGTAISSLSGAAATNATLAWLGGGSLATGGGGMAFGATVLSATTAVATGGVALLVAGLMANSHYSVKLTESKEFQKLIETDVAKHEELWVKMQGISQRIDELNAVTFELELRIKYFLEYLIPLVASFNFNDSYNTEVFRKVGILVKTMSDLAQTPLFDEKGELEDNKMSISIGRTEKVLNSNLVRYV